MSDFIVVANNVIQSVVDYTTNRQVVIAGVQGPQGPPGVSAAVSVSTLQDVDLTSLTNGSLLVYNLGNRVWKSTTALENQALEAGQY